MIWVLMKDGKHRRCEVAHADADGRYRLIVRRAGTPPSVEELGDPGAVIERTVAVMNQLRGEGWQLP